MFGKKRGRKEDLRSERLRLTASAAFHGYSIRWDYDRSINNKRTNYDLEIKVFLLQANCHIRRDAEYIILKD